jgi:hypothetical protein
MRERFCHWHSSIKARRSKLAINHLLPTTCKAKKIISSKTAQKSLVKPPHGLKIAQLTEK